MAPKPPEVVGQILAIPVAHIVVGPRLRPVDRIWASALGKIMAVEGQKTPIEVCQLPGRADYLLVAGAHRLEGARIEGFKTIDARLVSSSDIERRAREVSENLWRQGLSPIDRAAFVAEIIELLRVKAGLSPNTTPQQIAAQARWRQVVKKDAADAMDIVSAAYGIADEAGENLGLTARTIRRDLELHRGLSPDLVDRLRGLPIGTHAGQLRALAKMAQGEQHAVVELLVEGKARTATEALGMLRQKPPADAEKKAWSAFFGGWSRMNARRRREALKELAEQGLPKGVKITFEGDDHG